MTHTKQFIVNLDDAGYWDSPTQCYAADEIRSLIGRLVKVEAERDAALEQVAKWVAANGPEGWIDELRQEAKWRIATCQENEQLKSALREAKEAMVPLKEMVISPRMNKAIATINEVLGEEL